MKHVIAILGAAFFAFSLHAQTYTSQSLTDPDFPTATMGMVSYVDLSGQTGVGQTWDLTTADVSEEFQFGIIPVDEGAGNEVFPDANFALQLVTDGVFSTLYFDLTTSALQEMGYFVGEQETGVAQIYSDYKEYFTFPLTNGSSGADSFIGTFDFEGGFTQEINGDIAYEVVGTGTVITNAGTFENALLVYSTETVVTTMDLGGMDFETTTVSEAYDIIVEGFPMAVASMETYTTTSQGETETGEEGTVLTDVETHVEDFHIADVSIYPNPTEDQLTITCADCNGSVEVAVRSLSGRIVMSEQILSNQTTLDVRHLSPGLYVVEGRSNGTLFRQKLIIQ